MTTKEWLNRGFETYRRLQLKNARLESLGNIISRYEGREIETYHSENSSESTFLTWSETKREVEQLEARLYAIDRETKDAIGLLNNPNEYEILFLRYVMRLKWEEIEKATKYSRSHVFRLWNDGVDHVGEAAYRMIN
jgi:hypothetical protein